MSTLQLLANQVLISPTNLLFDVGLLLADNALLIILSFLFFFLSHRFFYIFLQLFNIKMVNGVCNWLHGVWDLLHNCWHLLQILKSNSGIFIKVFVLFELINFVLLIIYDWLEVTDMFSFASYLCNLYLKLLNLLDSLFIMLQVHIGQVINSLLMLFVK